MATLPRPPELTPEQLFLAHLEDIQKAAAHASRRHRLSPENTELFASWAIEKIIADNYGIIQKFRGDSTFRTYIVMVIQRLMLDFKNHIWGKWRNSAEAERLGPVAKRLEELLVRDGVPFEQACRILLTNEKVEMSWEDLDNLAGKLPFRNPPRRMEGEETIQNRPGAEADPERRMLGKENQARRQKILALFSEVLKTLPKEDQVIVRMRGEQKIVDIAKCLGLDQKSLYRRVEKDFAALRAELEKRGVSAEEIRGVFGFPEGPSDA